jgi:hypothetical protein
MIDFVHGGPNPAHLAIHNLFSDPAYLSPFVGIGTVDFNGLSSVVTNDTDLARNLALQINAMGTITYNYAPVPEPSSLFPCRDGRVRPGRPRAPWRTPASSQPRSSMKLPQLSGGSFVRQRELWGGPR